jgi:hypothetical protein
LDAGFKLELVNGTVSFAEAFYCKEVEKRELVNLLIIVAVEEAE